MYRHQEGVRDIDTGERLQGNELYYLYSDTKPITCVAALTLYEEGAFLLSDPVARISLNLRTYKCSVFTPMVRNIWKSQRGLLRCVICLP